MTPPPRVAASRMWSGTCSQASARSSGTRAAWMSNRPWKAVDQRRTSMVLRPWTRSVAQGCFRERAWWSTGVESVETGDALLLVPLGLDHAGGGIDDVVRTAAFQARILQLVIDVPAVVFQDDLNAKAGKIAIGFRRVCLSDRKRLISGQRNPPSDGIRRRIVHGWSSKKGFPVDHGGYPGPPVKPPRRALGPVT